MERTAPEIVGEALDNSPLTRIHKWIVALIAAGYFLDVLDYVIFGSMIPMMLKEHFASRNALALVGSAQLTGLAIGTLLQGQFTDRMGRKTVYQFNLLLFGLATLAGAFASDAGWLAVFRFVAGIGLGAEQPLGFAYAGEFAPKRLRGRILALIHFIGGAMVWPIAALLALFLGTAVGWRGLWIGIGIGALIVFGLRFALPESPRWLSSQGRHAEAFRTLARMGVATMQPVLAAYRDGRADEAIVRRDPFTIVWRSYGNRLLAAALSLSAFFCVTIGLGTWLPNILESKGFTITRSLTFTFGMTLAAPCASLVMMYTLDRYGRKVTSVTAFVGAGTHGDLLCPGEEQYRVAGRRFPHDLLLSDRRQCHADLYVRGVSHECACVRLRHGRGYWPAGRGWLHPPDSLDSKYIRAGCGLRHAGGLARRRRRHGQFHRAGDKAACS